MICVLAFCQLLAKGKQISANPIKPIETRKRYEPILLSQKSDEANEVSTKNKVVQKSEPSDTKKELAKVAIAEGIIKK